LANPVVPTGRAFAAGSGTIPFCGTQRTFYFSDTPLGRTIAQKVLSGGSYPDLGFMRDVRTIVDVGANIGASTLYFAGNYQQARILAFEPFLESYELLVRNVEGISRISTFNFGLFDRDKQAPLHLGLQDSVTNSIAVGRETSEDRHVFVNLREAGAVLAELNVSEVDILKLDTEGCELPILRSMSALAARAGVIYIEFHHEADRREIDRLLSPTHVLVLGRINSPHRGELSYALRGLVPPEVNDLAIVV
jgi:FkbM family methyltransferase